MPKVNYSLVCNRAIVDRRTNQLSIIDAIEEAHLETNSMPQEGQWVVLESLRLTLVTMFARTKPAKPEKHNVRVLVAEPGGQIFPEIIELTVDLESSQFCRNIAQFPAPYYAPGSYNYIIEYQIDDEKWAELFRTPLLLTIVPKESN